MSKKLIAFGLCILAICSLSSCKRDCEKEGHLWEVTSRVESTCVANGQETRECTACGFTETETLPLADHSWMVDAEVPSTCTSEGYIERKCTVCGATETEVIPIIDHQIVVDEYVEPTCSSAGYKISHCELCGANFREDFDIDPSNHIFDENIITSPTCMQTGLKEDVCKLCGYKTESKIPALGHDFINYKCANCGLLQDIPNQRYGNYEIIVQKEYDEWDEPTGNSDVYLVVHSAGYSLNGKEYDDANVQILFKPYSKTVMFSFFNENSSEGMKIAKYEGKSEIRYKASNGIIDSFSCSNDYTNAVRLETEIKESSPFSRYINVYSNYEPYYRLIYNLLLSESIRFQLDAENGYHFDFIIEYDPVILSRLLEKCGSDIYLTVHGDSITFSPEITYIDRSMIDSCNALISVVIPNSVTDIYYSAFKGCTNLVNIEIPDSVTSIGDSAFEDCTRLTDIVIPDSVTHIGDSAFEGCTSLSNITIPVGVRIGKNAFPDTATVIRK